MIENSDLESERAAELAAVKERLCAAIKEEGADAFWLVKPENIRYVTGFHGEDSTLLVAGGGYYLITDRRYSEEAADISFIDGLELREGAMAAAAGDLCKRLGARTLCMTAPNVNCADYKDISEACGCRAVSLRRKGIVEGMRLCKSARELQCIERCVRVAEKGFRRFVRHAGGARPERWLAGRLEWELRCAGADGAAFDTICAVAENGSRPHCRPTGRVLEEGESLLVDWGARIEGYNSDLTRVVARSTMPSEIEALSRVVLAAQEAAFEVLRPGVEACRVDEAARSVIEEAGYGRCFSHGLGHGVGLEVHEAPSLAPKRKERLQEGMVLTVEPAIYIPGRCGVRIEEMVCITGSGYFRFSEMEREPGCI